MNCQHHFVNCMLHRALRSRVLLMYVTPKFEQLSTAVFAQSNTSCKCKNVFPIYETDVPSSGISCLCNLSLCYFENNGNTSTDLDRDSKTIAKNEGAEFDAMRTIEPTTLTCCKGYSADPPDWAWFDFRLMLKVC